jgi:hypothetical protein
MDSRHRSQVNHLADLRLLAKKSARNPWELEKRSLDLGGGNFAPLYTTVGHAFELSTTQHWNQCRNHNL